MTTKAPSPAARFSEGASDDNVPAEEANKQEKKPVSVKTIIKNAKNENGSVIFKPKYLSPCRTSHTVLLVLAVVFVVASAALGSLDADKWVDARSDYLLSRGWYAESEPIRPSFHVVEVEAIELDVPDRKIVIRYDASATMVTVSCYDLYPGEYNISRSDTGTDRYIVSITRTPEPAHDADIDKMLDLCFQPNRIEKTGDRHHPRGIPQQCGDNHRSARHLREGLVSKRIKKRAASAALFHALPRLQSFCDGFEEFLCCSAPSRSRRRV